MSGPAATEPVLLSDSLASVVGPALLLDSSTPVFDVVTVVAVAPEVEPPSDVVSLPDATSSSPQAVGTASHITQLVDKPRRLALPRPIQWHRMVGSLRANGPRGNRPQPSRLTAPR